MLFKDIKKINLLIDFLMFIIGAGDECIYNSNSELIKYQLCDNIPYSYKKSILIQLYCYSIDFKESIISIFFNDLLIIN